MSEEVSLYRYNEQNGKWKNFKIEKTKDGIFLSMSEGKKGDKSYNRIVIKLEEAEVALIHVKTGKML